MITGSQEYEQFLANIAEAAPSVLKMRLPTNETIYEIDWNTRKVSAPPFIGVEGDHKAEYIFFKMDRFYDMIDLAETVGMVVFNNAHNESYYQLIPYYDIYSVDGKIIFPWAIQAPAALYSGVVSFSFKFFKVDPTAEHPKLLYEINTLIAKTKVLNGWVNTNGVEHTYNTLSPESIIIDNETLEKLNLILNSAKYTQIYWIDVEDNINIQTDEDYNGPDLSDAVEP